MTLNYAIASSANNRTIPLRVWIPDKSSDGTYPLAVLLHGRLSVPCDTSVDILTRVFPDGDGMQRIANAHSTVLCAPFCGDFAYCDSPIRDDVRVATFIGEELMEFCRLKLPVRDSRELRALCGFSMGGSGSVNILARYPHHYAIACNFAGNCDPGYGPRELGWEDSPAADVLGSFHTMPENHIRWNNFTAVDMLAGRKDVAIGLSCGVDDERLPIVRRLHKHIALKGLSCAFAEYPGAHIFTINHIVMQLAMVDILRDSIFVPY